MTEISISEFKKLQRSKLAGTGNSKPLKKSSGIDAKSKIELALISLKLNYVKEYKFLKGRQFRFDFAIPEMKIAIESEGIISNKSRHTTIVGYTGDCIKYNLAVIDNWRILRYTALNVGECLNDLERIIEK